MKSFSMLASSIIYVTVAFVVPVQGQGSSLDEDEYKRAFENGKTRFNKIQHTFTERMERWMHGI